MHPSTSARLYPPKRPATFLGVVWAGVLAVALPVAPARARAAHGPAFARPGWSAVAPAEGWSPLHERGAEEATALRTRTFALGQVPASEESSNWSGYEETGPGAHFTEVSAAWTVPQLEANITGSSSVWVGIDGASTPDLIQAGTEQDWTISGPLYYAWYELLPGAAIELGAVHPGDKVTALVQELSPGKWSISVGDSTSGRSWTQQVSYNAAGGTAEWVVEAPTSTSTSAVEPLAAFGSVTFSDISVGGTGTAGASASPVYMVHPGDELIEAYPGPYIGATDSFTDYFGSPTGNLVVGSAEIAPRVTTAAAGSEELPPGNGYWLAGAGGAVEAFGDAVRYSPPGGLALRQPVVAVLPAAGFRGYWLVARDGGVFGFGGAPYLGSLPALAAKASPGKRPKFSLPIAGGATSPDGKGYLLVSASGSVYAFGDARFAGSCTALTCTSHAVAIVADRSGRGYWVVLAGCQVVAFGDAPKIASGNCEAYARAARQRAVAAALSPDGRGMWALLSNGAIFALGDAKVFGNWAPPPPAGPSASPAVAIVLDRAGSGAWAVFANGTVKAYGDATALGPQAQGARKVPVVAAAGW